ncbi:conserved hypothetical protein [Roseibium sp. TrichSKD4]|uniref:hypothetical protein n=1 Tax=Roseibium sp. TrichSKD4 TaxID=744980 RepID=UPI0001E56261|nr:hypothetical protein [Roseibium sp. TrichSKD4]EFO32976.1 conserved hypothetical protein [Roseibium sp. TrichSKD4]
MLTFRLFGREFLMEQHCGTTAKDKWDFGMEVHEDDFKTLEAWFGPWHFATSSLTAIDGEATPLVS